MSSISPSKRPGAAELVRLPLRVHPENDEPILSMVVRLAAENKFDHVFGLTSLAGLPSVYIDRLSRVPVDMAGLAYASGITTNRLRYMQYLPVDDDHVSWLGTPVRRHMVHTKHRRWCPACLREAPYHRASWDLLPINACHRHRIALEARCPACRQHVGWHGKGIIACKCGTDLRRSAGVPVPDERVKAARCLVDGLIEKSGPDDFWVAATLGWFSSPGQMHQPTERSQWWRLDDMAGELEIGWLALQDWPQGFHAYMAQHHPIDRAPWPIYHWVKRQYCGPRQAEMVEALKEHFLQCGSKSATTVSCNIITHTDP